LSVLSSRHFPLGGGNATTTTSTARQSVASAISRITGTLGVAQSGAKIPPAEFEGAYHQLEELRDL